MVSERLRARRRELGLTQKEVVARLRGMGVLTTNKALSALEHGAGLDVAKLPELARALECTLTWLVGLTDSCQRWEPDAPVVADRAGGAFAACRRAHAARTSQAADHRPSALDRPVALDG